MGDAILPDRFRYWDLKEAISKVTRYGFSICGLPSETEIKGELAAEVKESPPGRGDKRAMMADNCRLMLLAPTRIYKFEMCLQ